MKVASVICEYNPFHNGHKYQLELIKKDFDAVICVMSGSFTQRGDVAVFDKWSRAKAAISCGADLVLELPVRYALSSAKDFAAGAVTIINSLGIVNSLVFGSESGSIDALRKAADILLCEPKEISEKIKAYMDNGMGYPSACTLAYDGTIDNEILANPNNILALEYIMALNRINSKITPITHTRTVGYFDKNEKENVASATVIREMLKSGEDIESLTPFDYSGLEIYDTNKLTGILKYKLICEQGDAFIKTEGYEAGLENRFKKAINCSFFDEMIDESATKRYTKARLRRFALRYILDIQGGYLPPSYIRVLGSNNLGINLLGEMKKRAKLPIITKVADFDDKLLAEEIRATDISALCADKPTKKGRDYYISPIML